MHAILRYPRHFLRPVLIPVLVLGGAIMGGGLFQRARANAHMDFLDRLASREDNVRRLALQRLGEMAPGHQERFQQEALTMLDSAEPQPRMKGIFVLTSIGARNHRIRVEAMLGDSDPAVRFTAALFLPTLGGRRVAGALVEALADRNRVVRWAAARSLGQIPLGEGLALAVWRLPEDGADRPVLLELLSASSLTLESRRDWVRLLASPIATDRRLALRALAVIGEPRSVPSILKCLDDPDGGVRATACVTLAELNWQPAITELGARADDVDPRVRANSLRALGLLRAPDTVQLCIAALGREPSGEVLPARRLVRPSVQFLNASRQPVRFPFNVGLDVFEITTPLDWAGSDERNVRFAAVVALILCGDDRAEAVLQRAARDPDSRVREAAAVGLTSVGTVETMTALLKEAQRPVRARLAAVQWLGTRNLEESLPAFLDACEALLNRGDESADAARLIEELVNQFRRARSAAALPVLKTAAQHPASPVRIAAARALTSIGGDEARAVVEDLSRHDYDRAVVEAATRELGRFSIRSKLERMR